MKTVTGYGPFTVCFVVVLFLLTNGSFGQVDTPVIAGNNLKLSPVPWEQLPPFGTFWYLTRRSAPLPFYPSFLRDYEAPVYAVDEKQTIFVIDDRLVPWEEIDAQRTKEAAERKEAWQVGLLTDAEYYALEGVDGPIVVENYLEGDFWIELVSYDQDLSQATLTLHGTKQYFHYQLLSKDELKDPDWKLGEVIYNQTDTNQIFFQPVSTAGTTNRFYRGVQGDFVASIAPFTKDAVEPSATNNLPGQPATFEVSLSPMPTNDVAVYFRVTGTAQNGVDFSNIFDHVTVPANTSFGYITIYPIDDGSIEFVESATIALVLTNGYVVEPDHASSTVFIHDYLPTNLFTTVVTGLTEVVGIDYHPPTQSLLVSQHFSSVDDWNFLRINTNGVVTNWSTIRGLNEEKKLCVVQSTTNGFTQGEMFFGTGVNGVIGKVSADGSQTNLTWAVLTTNNATTESLIRGSLYVDRTGIFEHDLIAVTGAGPTEGGGVWKIHSPTNLTLLTHLTNTHLEGVITLTNDVQKWGPWAGKVVTGAESETPPVIITLDTNGAAIPFRLGIAPEDFDIIPPDQDLYISAYHEGQVLKLSSSLLTNYVGDLLITQEATKLFIVKWNSVLEKFEVRSLPVRSGLRRTHRVGTCHFRPHKPPKHFLPMKIFSNSCLSIALSFAMATETILAQGTFLYDQQSSDESYFGSGGAGIQANQLMGQSFTPVLSFVDFIRLSVYDGGQNNSLGATLYLNLRSNSIGGPILGSTYPVSLPDNFGRGSNGVVNFFFPTSMPLSSGVTYFFQPVVQSGDAWGVAYYNTFDYSGGSAYVLGSPVNGFDLWFREGIVVPSRQRWRCWELVRCWVGFAVGVPAEILLRLTLACEEIRVSTAQNGANLTPICACHHFINAHDSLE